MELTNQQLQEILKQYPDAGRDRLIPILQEIQKRQGYLSRESVVRIGEHLRLPTSKIYGVATFYNQFRFQPLGKNHILVCRGTACHVRGSAGVLDAVRRFLKIEPGQTTRDGLFSLEVVACIGACGQAPVLSINGEFFAAMTPRKTEELLDSLRKKEVAHAN